MLSSTRRRGEGPDPDVAEDASRLMATLGPLPAPVARTVLVALIGLPGTGKSTVARRIADGQVTEVGGIGHAPDGDEEARLVEPPCPTVDPSDLGVGEGEVFWGMSIDNIVFMFCDDDKDDKLEGMRYRFQWAPTVSYPFRRTMYPRFVLDK